MGRANGRVGSQNPRPGLVQGTDPWPAGRDTAAPRLPMPLGTNLLTLSAVVQTVGWGESTWPWGPRRPGVRLALALPAVRPRARRLPSLGLDLLFYDRDHYCSFTCFADAEW